MAKNNDKNEKKKEVREALSCNNCGSHFVYRLVDGTVVCRKCSHRASPED